MANHKINLLRAAAKSSPPAATSVEDRFARTENLRKTMPHGFADEPGVVAPQDGMNSAVLAGLREDSSASAKAISPSSATPAIARVTQPSLDESSAHPSRNKPRYEEVPLELVRDNPFNARFIYQPEQVAALASSLREEGQLVPGIAVRRGDHYILVAAHYRKRALKLAGIPTIKLMVYEHLTDKELYKLSYKENQEHSGQSAMDTALAWKNLMDKKVYEDYKDIAEAIGMSRSNVVKILSIMNVGQEVLDVVEQNPNAFSMTSLYEIALLQKAAGSQIAVKFAHKVMEEGISRDAIKDARLRYEGVRSTETSKRTNEVASTFHLWDKGMRIGEIRNYPNGKLRIEVTITDPEENKKMRDSILKNFELREYAGASDPVPAIEAEIVE
jgi:ParB family chromosome partitioning protein